MASPGRWTPRNFRSSWSKLEMWMSPNGMTIVLRRQQGCWVWNTAGSGGCEAGLPPSCLCFALTLPRNASVTGHSGQAPCASCSRIRCTHNLCALEWGGLWLGTGRCRTFTNYPPNRATTGLLVPEMVRFVLLWWRNLPSVWDKKCLFRGQAMISCDLPSVCYT